MMECNRKFSPLSVGYHRDEYLVLCCLLLQVNDICNVSDLIYTILYAIGFMMYKHVNGLLPEVMNKLYVTNNQIHNHFTRQHHLFHISKGRTNVYAKSVSNISPRIWNALQTKINVKVSIYKFKNITKIFFLEKHYKFFTQDNRSLINLQYMHEL